MIYLRDPDVTLHHGDVLDVLREMPAESVDCVVTSPPYWGLRDYGTGTWEGGEAGCDHQKTPRQGRVMFDGSGRPGRNNQSWGERETIEVYRDTCGKCGATRIDQQLGLEPTPELYVERMVEVFREVRRVLAPHGTVWCNLGDSFQDKQLVGVPWKVAFALQADGWYLRSDIIWSKPNPMPESVTDRPTKAHEYVFLLSKQPRYFFDTEAVREEYAPKTLTHRGGGKAAGKIGNQDSVGKVASGNFGDWDKPRTAHPRPRPQEETLDGSEGEAPRGPDGRRNTHVEAANGSIQHRDGERWPNGGRNIRSVWEIATQPYPEAHFATFPEELARRCIAAGCPEQVCRVCGKARERVVERELVETRGKVNVNTRTDPMDSGSQHPWTGGVYGHYDVTTTGYTDCGHTDYRPGITLDPFMGSGTVAHVARKLGRHAVGIDLNADYLELAAKRLQQQSLFAEGIA